MHKWICESLQELLRKQLCRIPLIYRSSHWVLSTFSDLIFHAVPLPVSLSFLPVSHSSPCCWCVMFYHPVSPSDPDLSISPSHTDALIFHCPASLPEECSMWHVALWLLILVSLPGGEWLIWLWLCSNKRVFFTWRLRHMCVCERSYDDLSHLYNCSSLSQHGYTLFFFFL